VLEVVGADVEDWQIVLVLWWLFGVLVRKNRCWRWLGPTWRMGKACWFCGDFSACWCGKIGVGGPDVLVLWRLFGLLMRENRCWRWWVPTWRMGKACWFCGGFSACWCGKVEVKGLKDQTCWFCGDFSACWCGKVGVGGGGCQRGGWAKCVGFVV